MLNTWSQFAEGDTCNIFSKVGLIKLLPFHSAWQQRLKAVFRRDYKNVFAIMFGIFFSLFCRSAVAISDGNIFFYSDAAPPFVQLNDENQPEGALVDLVKEISKRSQITSNIEILPWARANQEIKSKANAFLLMVVKTEARSEYLQWIGKLYEFEINVLHLKSRPELNISGIDQAKSRLSAAVRDYAAANYLLTQGFEERNNLVLTSNPEGLWHLLFKGRADYAVISLVMSRSKIQSLGYDDNDLVSTLAIESPSLSTELFLAAGTNTADKVVHKVRVALEEIKADGSYAQLLSDWGM